MTSVNPATATSGMRYNGSALTWATNNGFAVFARRPPNVATRTGVVMAIVPGGTISGHILIPDLDNPIPQWYYNVTGYGKDPNLTVDCYKLGQSEWVRFGFSSRFLAGGAPNIYIYPTSANALSGVSPASVASGMGLDLWGPQGFSTPGDGIPPYTSSTAVVSMQAEFVRLFPSAIDVYDIESAEKLRASNGSMFQIRTGSRKSFHYSLSNMDELSRRYVNDWWENQDALYLQDYTYMASSGMAVTSCRIANDSTPLARLSPAYSDQYDGVVDLEVF